jgi:hypothetical protein
MGARAGASSPSGQIDNPGEETLLRATAAELTKFDAEVVLVISGGVVGASAPFIMLDSNAVEFVFRAFVSQSRASEQWRSALGERAGVGLLTVLPAETGRG